MNCETATAAIARSVATGGGAIDPEIWVHLDDCEECSLHLLDSIAEGLADGRLETRPMPARLLRERDDEPVAAVEEPHRGAFGRLRDLVFGWRFAPVGGSLALAAGAARGGTGRTPLGALPAILPGGEAIDLEIVDPPAVTPEGEFVLAVATRDERCRDRAIRCAIVSGEEEVWRSPAQPFVEDPEAGERVARLRCPGLPKAGSLAEEVDARYERQAAGEVLGTDLGGAPWDALIAVLTDSGASPALRSRAARALAQLDRGGTHEQLIDLLNDVAAEDDPEVSGPAQTVLSYLESDAEPVPIPPKALRLEIVAH